MSRSTSVWATDPRDELPIKMGTEGISAYPPTTVMDVFKKTVEKHRDGPALRFKDLSSVSFLHESEYSVLFGTPACHQKTPFPCFQVL